MTPSPDQLLVAMARLPRPAPHHLLGHPSLPVALPENLLCFCRRTEAELNQPRQGRALHHRHVLIVALSTAVTVCVDDRALRLSPGEGLLVLPFQFHHYLHAERSTICWLFITFDLEEDASLQKLRFRPFTLTSEVRAHLASIVRAFRDSPEGELARLHLALLLAHLKQLAPKPLRATLSPGESKLVMQVNRLLHSRRDPTGAQEIARILGISASHLRARFRISCGESLGRHLRRLRLEKACGLLRLGSQRVSEIAELCGFSSIYSFSRAFRTAYGVSPLFYRNGKAEAMARRKD